MQSPSRSGNSNGSGSAAVGPVFEGLSVFEPKDEWSRLCGTVRRTTTHLAYLDLGNDTPCLEEVAQKSIDGSTFCSCCLTRVGRSVNEIRCIPVWCTCLVWSGLVLSYRVLSCLVLARMRRLIKAAGAHWSVLCLAWVRR
jgi:hypothetical protein